jgi:predicted permease
MLVGVYGSKRNIITPEVNKALINILIEIALPFMILASFIFTYDETIKFNVLKTFIYSPIAYIIIAVISAFLLIPIKKDKRTILHFSNIFTNTGYIGFPILNAMYGAEAVIYGSVFNMFFVIFLWTYGIFLFTGSIEKDNLKKELLKILFNPSIIAVALGMIIMIFDIVIPELLLNTIRSVGNITGPLSMIIVGATLAKVEFKKSLKDPSIYYGMATRLIIIPLVIYLISILIGDRGIVSNAVIVMSAMPAASMTSILAENYELEAEYAATMVLMTTVFALLTIPFLVRVLI